MIISNSNSKCKICRRLETKLFLKGERCFTSKCALVKRPYPPGSRGKRGRGSFSEYGMELKEKQKLRNLYQLGEKIFKKYVTDALAQKEKGGSPVVLLFKKLESRLDNVVFRLGFAPSRSQARQMVSHGFFLVDKKPINVPSFLVKLGQEVSLKPNLIKRPPFQNIKNVLKKQKVPKWLKLDVDKLSGKVVGEPTLEEINAPAETLAIFEYYSR